MIKIQKSFANDDEEKCDLLNNYFSFISKLDKVNAHFLDIELNTYNNITDLDVSVEEIYDINQILRSNKGVFNLRQHFEILYSRYVYITGVNIPINDSYR